MSGWAAATSSYPNISVLSTSSIPSLKTYHSQVLERPSLLNILECLLQIPQLLINHTLRLLGALHRLLLKRLDRFNLPCYIVCLGLESTEGFLDFVDDGSVLKNAAVMAEVDGLGLLGQDGDFAARVVVALFEGLERGCGLTFETQLGANFGPVELESGATLQLTVELVF
jgi:hypothetical protein